MQRVTCDDQIVGRETAVLIKVDEIHGTPRGHQAQDAEGLQEGVGVGVGVDLGLDLGVMVGTGRVRGEVIRVRVRVWAWS